MARLSYGTRETATDVAALGGRLERQADLQTRMLALQQKATQQQQKILDQQPAHSNAIVKVQQQQTELLGELRHPARRTSRRQDAEVTASDDSLVSAPAGTALTLPQRAWPSDLQSLKGWIFSSLLFRYWVDELGDIPRDHRCHTQRDVRQAVGIAQTLLGDRYPNPQNASDR